MRYRVLYLGGSSRYMTLATLSKIRALVAEGATVVGERPMGSPSLADDESAHKGLIDQLWGKRARCPISRHYGRGRLYAGHDLKQVLSDSGWTPDWLWS